MSTVANDPQPLSGAGSGSGPDLLDIDESLSENKRRGKRARGIDTVPENKQLSKSARVEAGFQSSRVEENKTLSGRDVSGANPEPEMEQHRLRSMRSFFGLSKDDEVNASHGDKCNGLIGIACFDCLDFQLDLAKSALEYYEKRKNDPMVFDDVQVFAACFLNSWPRSHFTSCECTDKCHISFSAKLRDSGVDDVSTKWFFAELLETDNGDFRPTICVTMDPTDPGIFYGCRYCPSEKKFPHPPHYREHFKKRQPLRIPNGEKAVGFRHRHRLAKASGGSEDDDVKLQKNNGLSEIDAAKAALTYKDMDSSYEVDKVEYLERMPFAWVEIEGTNMWYHVGFKARPKNSCRSDASSIHFFGELKFCEDTQNFVPTFCCIMEPSDSGLRRGCGFCPPNEHSLHPADGYKCGSWADPPSLEVPAPYSLLTF